MTGIVEVSSNVANESTPVPWPGITSRFQLVILAAHRSKQLLRGAQPRILADRLKRRNTSIALEELKRGLIPFKPLAVEEAPSVAGDHDERHRWGAPSALFQRNEVMETRSGTEDQQGRLELVAGASANARIVSETGWSS